MNTESTETRNFKLLSNRSSTKEGRTNHLVTQHPDREAELWELPLLTLWTNGENKSADIASQSKTKTNDSHKVTSWRHTITDLFPPTTNTAWKKIFFKKCQATSLTSHTEKPVNIIWLPVPSQRLQNTHKKTCDRRSRISQTQSTSKTLQQKSTQVTKSPALCLSTWIKVFSLAVLKHISVILLTSRCFPKSAYI